LGAHPISVGGEATELAVIWNVPPADHGQRTRPLSRFWRAVTYCLLAVASTSASESLYEIYYQHRLTNETSQPLRNIRVYIPLAQNSSYQKITNFEMEVWGRPLPTKIQRDEFGQPIADITIPLLLPGEEVEVGFSCEAALHAVERVELHRDEVGTLSDIPPEVRSTYTADVKSIYGLSDPGIQREARRFARLHPNLIDRVLAIHDFVAGELVYQRGGGWDAASEVLRRKSGSCSEFTFLFCALCRATGLPTRLVGGSWRQEQVPPTYRDTLCHRWAEVYLPPYGWVPFDVTADRGKPPKRKYAGTHRADVLILSKLGGGGMLGTQYIGANSHCEQLTRQRSFTWSRGAREAYAKADQSYRRKEYQAALKAFTQIVERFGGTKWAKLAEARLETMKAHPRSDGDDP